MKDAPALAAQAAGSARRRRARDPDGTRAAILEAARTLLAQDGPEGLSLSQVAQRAGVNRGTAYQHFATREKLIQATMAWVSDRLYRVAFGDPADADVRRLEQIDVAGQAERIAQFAMDNPELCRIWLLQVLDSDDPRADPFCREYLKWLELWARTELAEPGIDVEIHAVTMLAGTFLWPIWARAQQRGAGDRGKLARRFVHENLRLSLYGSLRAAHYPQIVGRFDPAGEAR